MVAVSVLTIGFIGCTENQEDTNNTDINTTAQQATETPAATVITTAQNDSIGTYLTDQDGRALYMFLKDQQGSSESTCYDKCAEVWPPYIAETGSVMARPPAADSLLSTFKRKDESVQVSYNGWPLYYFIKDQGASQIKGQDMKGFGAEWYLVTPKGTEAEASH